MKALEGTIATERSEVARCKDAVDRLASQLAGQQRPACQAWNKQCLCLLLFFSLLKDQHQLYQHQHQHQLQPEHDVHH